MRKFLLASLLAIAGCGSPATKPQPQSYAEALEVFTNEKTELERLNQREDRLIEDLKAAAARDGSPGTTPGFPKKVEAWLDETKAAVDAQIKRVDAAKKAKEDAWAREH